MEKLKVGDSVLVVKTIYPKNVPTGTIGKVSSLCDDDSPRIKVKGSDYQWTMEVFEVEKIHQKITSESRSKRISQSLKQICTKGLVIKSEDIIAKVKESIGTEYVFGDTILRALRHLRQDGILDYTADKNTREYTFR